MSVNSENLTPNADQNQAGANTNGRPPKPELTERQKLEQKIENLGKSIKQFTAARERAIASLNVIDKLESIEVNTVVTIRLGRADTARDVTGVVVGKGADDKGVTKLKVYHGEGFDATVDIVGLGQIVDVPAPAVATE